MVTSMSLATTPHKVFTILLIIFPMLYITSPWLTYFVTESLYLLISLQLFRWTSHPLSSGNCQAVLCVYTFASVLLFVQLLCFLDSTCKWNQTVFVFLWFILLSMLPPRPIHVVTNGKISLFFMVNNIPLLTTFSLSIHLLIDTLLPYIGHCICYNEHWGAYTLSN